MWISMHDCMWCCSVFTPSLPFQHSFPVLPTWPFTVFRQCCVSPFVLSWVKYGFQNAVRYRGLDSLEVWGQKMERRKKNSKGIVEEGCFATEGSARRDHWLLTFKTSVWWRDACSFPAASHPSGPQSAMIDEATGSVTPLCKACLPFAMLSLSLCLPLLPLLQVLRYTGGWWIFCMSVYVCACSMHILTSSPKCLCIWAKLPVLITGLINTKSAE